MKKKEILFGLLIAVILAIFSFLASSSPDGLERVAEDKNFLEKAFSLIRSPLPDYLLPFEINEQLSTVLAGITGVFIVFILGWQAAKLLKHKK